YSQNILDVCMDTRVRNVSRTSVKDSYTEIIPQKILLNSSSKDYQESILVNITKEKGPLKLIGKFLDKYDSKKIEILSVFLGVSGVGCLIFGVCILIIFYTAYNSRLSTIDCKIKNVTYPYVKLCKSKRCEIFNYCVPYVCTIVYVEYLFENVHYQEKLLSDRKQQQNDVNDSVCSFEPFSCISRPRIEQDHVDFIKRFGISNKDSTCCIDKKRLPFQPIACISWPLKFGLQLFIFIICFLFGIVLLIAAGLSYLHIMRLSHRRNTKQDILNTILDFRFSDELSIISDQNIKNDQDHASLDLPELNPTPKEVFDNITKSLSKTPKYRFSTSGDALIAQSNTLSHPFVEEKKLPNDLLFNVTEEIKIFQNERERVNIEECLLKEIL
ncbi:unnamed protein product, partial [Didymodactylos carnosus]